jgi:hypothetical protein
LGLLVKVDGSLLDSQSSQFLFGHVNSYKEKIDHPKTLQIGTNKCDIQKIIF